MESICTLTENYIKKLNKNIETLGNLAFYSLWISGSLQNGWIWKHAAAVFMVFVVFLNSSEMQYQMKDHFH